MRAPRGARPGRALQFARSICRTDVVMFGYTRFNVVNADALTPRTGFRPLGRPVVRFSLVFLFDAAIAIASLWIAMFLRFEGNIDPAYWALMPAYTGVLVACRFAANLLLRLHRWSFRL